MLLRAPGACEGAFGRCWAFITRLALALRLATSARQARAQHLPRHLVWWRLGRAHGPQVAPAFFGSRVRIVRRAASRGAEAEQRPIEQRIAT